jgi:hypothetical protein
MVSASLRVDYIASHSYADSSPNMDSPDTRSGAPSGRIGRMAELIIEDSYFLRICRSPSNQDRPAYRVYGASLNSNPYSGTDIATCTDSSCS